MSRDGEKLIELVNELGGRITHLLSDMVPPAAQVHLLNAQRELITAMMLIYEHRMTSGPTGRAGRAAGAGRRASPRRRKSPRAGKIPIE
ncbi:MAG TPA: hypothetical protein VLR46_11060 [Candidatus Dormibacteraeota bacterium]|nr:hypothetical protein [Candidatus Dormibacteraeota bacterium]